MKSLHFKFKYKVYPFSLYVSIGETDDQVIEGMKKLGMDENFDSLKLHGDGRCVFFECGWTVMRLNEMPTCPRTRGILAHEIFHAVHFLLDHIGLKLTYESGEAFAYLTDYITEKIYSKIDAHSQPK